MSAEKSAHHINMEEGSERVSRAGLPELDQEQQRVQTHRGGRNSLLSASNAFLSGGSSGSDARRIRKHMFRLLFVHIGALAFILNLSSTSSMARSDLLETAPSSGGLSFVYKDDDEAWIKEGELIQEYEDVDGGDKEDINGQERKIAMIHGTQYGCYDIFFILCNLSNFYANYTFFLLISLLRVISWEGWRYHFKALDCP